MPEFDLTRFYSLFEAFDMTGRRIFGDVWRGIEAFAEQTGDPKATQQERDAILARLRKLAVEASPHDAMMVHGAGEEAWRDASDALAVIDRERASLRERLGKIPDVMDASERDHEAYLRRRRVEDELKDAFARGELLLLVAPHRLADWRRWSEERDCRIYFGLSMVRLPSAVSSNRRGPAFVDRVALDRWLRRFGDAAEEGASLSIEAQLEHWIVNLVHLSPRKEKSVDEYFEDSKRAVPGISRRMFDRVWGRKVPGEWKRPGPIASREMP